MIVRCPFCVLRKWGFTMNFIQYIKQTWKAGTSGGTPLSPDRLNHIEDGIKNNNDMISKLNNNITILNISKGSFFDTINEKIEISGFSCCKVGSFLQLYAVINVKDDALTGTGLNPVIIASINYKPNIRYVLGLFQKNAVPYNIADNTSFWIANDGKISMYGKLPVGQYYICVAYITQ